MISFSINHYIWHLRYVQPTSSFLVDRTGNLTVATTDPLTLTVYISADIHGEFLKRVIRHELAHCVMISYNLIADIHDVVEPALWIDAEEWVCNFIADYGGLIFQLAENLLS